MTDTHRTEIKARLDELVKLVERQDSKQVLPANIATTIADRISSNFDPLQSYEKGGVYTKPGGPDGYPKGGTYDKVDNPSGNSVNQKQDIVLKPGDIEGLTTTLRLSAVLGHQEVRRRLESVIESEVSKYKDT